MSEQNPPPTYDRIDRNPQNLPMPVGDFDVFHSRRRPSEFRKWIRLRTPPAMISLGVAGAIAGAVLTILQPPTPVYLENGDIYVAGNVLRPSPTSTGGATTYTGNGAVVLQENSDGTAAAGGSTVLDGMIVTGSCRMQTLSTIVTDKCRFMLGGTQVSSIDTYDLGPTGDHNWHRQYSDGKSTLISVPTDGALIPVPFPVGR
jgi:hypothetical protein